VKKERDTVTNQYPALYQYLGRPVVILDFETTGLNPQTDRVIEIACVLHDRGGRHEFQAMVRPDVIPDPLPEFVTERSGITLEMIKGGSPSLVAFSHLRMVLADVDLLVGHNLAKFDLAFLKMELFRNGLAPWSGDFIDTMVLATFTGTGIERTNRGGYRMLGTTLTDVCQALAVPLEGAHRAMNDVRATEEILGPLYHRALSQKRPILNAMVHPQRLLAKGVLQPEYVPPRAIVYNVA
jgi:DNA polymerase-3 subunit epsilon